MAALLALASPVIACADDNADTVDVSLSEPTDGATLAGGVPLRMVADGIDIEEAGEVAPAGKRITTAHIHWYRIVDGKILEHWANRDDLGVARQLGIVEGIPTRA